MQYYVEDRQSQVGLTGTVRSINDAVLHYAVLYGEIVECVVAGVREIPLYPVGKSSVVFYGKFC